MMLVQTLALERAVSTSFGSGRAFQAEFDRAVKLAPPAYWAADGVHPTPAGHLLMTRAWLKSVQM